MKQMDPVNIELPKRDKTAQNVFYLHAVTCEVTMCVKGIVKLKKEDILYYIILYYICICFMFIPSNEFAFVTVLPITTC